MKKSGIEQKSILEFSKEELKYVLGGEVPADYECPVCGASIEQFDQNWTCLICGYEALADKCKGDAVGKVKCKGESVGYQA